MQPQDMPLQMDPAASRPVAAPLPAPKTPAQQREAEREVASALEMIPGRLYHYGAKWAPVDTDEAHFFSIDATLVYEPFAFDFGPLHVGRTFRFCELMRMKLRDPALTGKRLYFYCTTADERFASNAAVLIGAFLIIWEGKTAKDAYAPFAAVRAKFAPFRDASYWPSDYDITVSDTLDGIYKAVTLGWVDFTSFDLQQYEFFEAVENGDLTVVVPGKFIAFAGPSYNGWTPPPGYYAEHFKRMGVTTVIRTNNKLYDRTEFTRVGLKHYDLFFPDGTPPPEAQARRFLSIVESEPGVVAVHCKAGLGRTGTLILMWCMKHFRWGADEAIGYLRWMRPGSIIGPQQQFLKANEQRLWRMGNKAAEKGLPPTDATMHSHSGTNTGSRAGGGAGAGPAAAGPERPVSSQQELGSSISIANLSGTPAEQDRPTTFGGGGASGTRRVATRTNSSGGVRGGGRRIRGRSGVENLGSVQSRASAAAQWRNQTSTLSFGRSNGTASLPAGRVEERPMHHRLTHSLNGSPLAAQAAAAQANGNGHMAGPIGQRLAQMKGAGKDRVARRLPRSFDEVASDTKSGGSSGGGARLGLQGLTRSTPALQPLGASARAGSRGGVQRSSSRGAPARSKSRGALGGGVSGSRATAGRQQPRLAFGEAPGSGFKASVGTVRSLSPLPAPSGSGLRSGGGLRF